MDSNNDDYGSGPKHGDEFGPNSGYIREVYDLYLQDPTLVGPSWTEYFQKHTALSSQKHTVSSQKHTVQILDGQISDGQIPGGAANIDANILLEQETVFRVIRNIRERGHSLAKLDPLEMHRSEAPAKELDMELLLAGLADDDEYLCDGLAGHSALPLAEIKTILKQSYCSGVGMEIAHLFSEEERMWLALQCETRAEQELSLAQKKRFFEKLTHAELLESELHKKYVGQKRFSLQGGESLIPLLDAMLDAGAELGLRQCVIGMAHRGRLNVLVNILGKPLGTLFSEFEDQNLATALGAGDVKYHLGASHFYTTLSGKNVRMFLAPNPSHLEFVNPVVLGMVRAIQDGRFPEDPQSVAPLLLHGDAAVIGQGVVAESFNMMNLPGYTTRGCLHVVINNQVGFTTNPEDSRSSRHCTALGLAFEAPILHVNAEDFEALAWAARVAMEFRQKYARDVIIDLVCYRRYGHNEGDDPSFTQPLMYEKVAKKQGPSEIYGNMLLEQGVLSKADQEQIQGEFRAGFQAAEGQSNALPQGEVCATFGKLRVPNFETGVSEERLLSIARQFLRFPDGFTPHPKLLKILEKRLRSVEDGRGIDWGTGELLAYGTLAQDGKHIRLSGQDSGRGTFSHRHLELHDYHSGRVYNTLSPVAEQYGTHLEVYNSCLSEAAVLGFEFGYASKQDDSLVLWEAQFGDFANGAQVIIDQFIASSEAKWAQRSGISLLLPHGFEGQGPEHSSARLERFLQLCAEGNMSVCYPSNTAQYFHLLRRQGLQSIQRPLVVMTPKSLLRNLSAAASIDQLCSGHFQPLLQDDFGGDGKPESVIMCSGKVYYDLLAQKEAFIQAHVRVLRLEQLYPFPQFELKKALKDIQPKNVLWVQEEPQNSGAWNFVQEYLRQKIGLDIRYIGRSAAPAPATGSGKWHGREQAGLIAEALQLIRES